MIVEQDPGLAADLLRLTKVDVCADHAEDLVEELEWTVRTVVSVGYSERFDPWPPRWIGFRLADPEVGTRPRRSGTEELPDEQVKLARIALPAGRQWLPWQQLAPDGPHAG